MARKRKQHTAAFKAPVALPETAANLRLMRLLEAEYTVHPFLGSRR